MDITTGSIRIVSAFPNPNNILRPGQFGRVRAATETVKVRCWFPKERSTSFRECFRLAVVGDGNKVSVRSVKVGERVGTMWIIQSGVKPGELVIVEGLQKVRDGSVVKPKQSTAVAKGN